MGDKGSAETGSAALQEVDVFLYREWHLGIAYADVREMLSSQEQFHSLSCEYVVPAGTTDYVADWQFALIRA